MDLRPPTTNEHGQIRRLLADASLPTQDLETAAIDFIVAADSDGRIVGVVGVEVFEGGGLLRSLVVQPACRGTGLGERLVQAAEARARDRGLPQLVLLTQTAERFFSSRGYRRIERDDVPAALRGSSEFRSLCPASADCLSKPITPENR